MWKQMFIDRWSGADTVPPDVELARATILLEDEGKQVVETQAEAEVTRPPRSLATVGATVALGSLALVVASVSLVLLTMKPSQSEVGGGSIQSPELVSSVDNGGDEAKKIAEVLLSLTPEEKEELDRIVKVDGQIGAKDFLRGLVIASERESSD